MSNEGRNSGRVRVRCKACDNKMTSVEMVIRPETGEFDDLCLPCRRASEDDDDTVMIEIEVGLIKEKYQWED